MPKDKSPAVLTTEDHRLTGHRAAVLCMVLDRHKQKLFSGSLDGLIKVQSCVKFYCSIASIRTMFADGLEYFRRPPEVSKGITMQVHF